MILTDDLRKNIIIVIEKANEFFSSNYSKKHKFFYDFLSSCYSLIKDDKELAFSVLKNCDFSLVHEFFPSIYSQIFEDKKLWLEAIKYNLSIFEDQPSFWDKETVLYYLNKTSEINIKDFNNYFSDSDIRSLLSKKFTYNAFTVGILTPDETTLFLKKDVLNNSKEEISMYSYKFDLNENTALPEVEKRKRFIDDSTKQQVFSYFPFIKDLYDEHDEIYDSVIDLCSFSVIRMRKMLFLSDYDKEFILNLINNNSLYWFYLPYEIQNLPYVKNKIIESNPEMEKYISKYGFNKTL